MSHHAIPLPVSSTPSFQPKITHRHQHYGLKDIPHVFVYLAELCETRVLKCLLDFGKE